jgi:DNA-binding NarL/FixJ family response regulator
LQNRLFRASIQVVSCFREKPVNGKIIEEKIEPGPAGKAHVFVADDNSFVRAGLKCLLNQQKDMVCCGEADSLLSIPPAIAKCNPHLLLLDLRFQDGEAFELIPSLKHQFPTLPILVVSQCEEGLYAERAFQAGARGYIMKQSAGEELLNAIRILLQGGVYFSAAMAARFAGKTFGPSASPLFG